MEMILINGGIAYSKKLPYSFIHAYIKNGFAETIHMSLTI